MGDKEEKRSGKHGRRLSKGLAAVIVVMVILILGAGTLVFAGPSFIAGPTQVANISTSTSTSVSTALVQVVNTSLSASSNATLTQTSSINATATAPPASASVMLDSAPGAQHALFYEADHQGYFAANGLQVKIEPGTGSAATVNSVASGQAQFGMVDASTAINAISGGAGIQILGAVSQTQPFAIFYLKSSGIASPADLQGKTYCSSVASAAHLMFPAYAKATGINMSTIKFMNVDPPYYSLLVSGACQFTTGLLYSLSSYIAAANQSGLPTGTIQYFTYASAGIDPYGFVIVANNQVVKTDPNLVEHFLNATYEGLHFVLNNQQQALGYMVSIIPDGNSTIQSGQLDTFTNASAPLMSQSSYNQADSRTLGILNSSLINQTAGYTVKYLNAKPIPASETYYTSSFLTCTASECG